jgi:hypothetical protein
VRVLDFFSLFACKEGRDAFFVFFLDDDDDAFDCSDLDDDEEDEARACAALGRKKDEDLLRLLC